MVQSKRYSLIKEIDEQGPAWSGFCHSALYFPAQILNEEFQARSRAVFCVSAGLSRKLAKNSPHGGITKNLRDPKRDPACREPENVALPAGAILSPDFLNSPLPPSIFFLSGQQKSVDSGRGRGETALLVVISDDLSVR